jgi:hypothetical protein
MYVRAGQVTCDNLIWRMHFAYWLTKAIATHSVYLILTAFPRRQWLRERASVCHSYASCLSSVFSLTPTHGFASSVGLSSACGMFELCAQCQTFFSLSP